MIRRRIRRFAVGLVARYMPGRHVRTYALWALGLPPLAGAEDPPTPEQIAEWKRKSEAYDPEKKFTQADVDRVVQDRLARDRKDRPSDEQVNAWKERAERYDEAVNAGRTELEREQEARKQAEQQLEQTKQAAEEATKSAQKTLRKSAIVAAAAKAGAIDPEEVHALLADRDFTYKAKAEDGSEKELKVTIGDDGQVTGVEDTLKAFLAEKKHLVGTARRPNWDGGSRKPAPEDANDLASLTDAKAVREAVSKL